MSPLSGPASSLRSGGIGTKTPPGRDARDLALGRILLALRDGQLLAHAEHIDWWATIDGHIDIEWEFGPYPFEVVTALIDLSRNEEMGDTTLLESDLQGITCDPTDRYRPASLVLGGVRVRFRALHPLGREAATLPRG